MPPEPWRRNTPFRDLPSPPSVCLFPTCVAFAVDKRDHCPVHSPEKVLARAKQIVLQQFEAASHVEEGTGRPTTYDILKKLKADILKDLDGTV